MPPRAAKKSGGSAGKKAPARAARGAAKASTVVAEETAKVEEVTISTVVETKEEIKIQEVVDVKKSDEKPSIKGSETKGAVDSEDAEDAKEAYEEDIGERLELEDNEPEYEAEEDTAVDYDERDTEHAEGQELDGGEGEEDVEGDIIEEEEAEMVDEEMEDGAEDAVGEGEEHEVEEDDEEHHEVVKEHQKRKEFEVFVGGLDKDATEEDLRKVFSKVGEITEVRLLMNPHTKKNKGFAFLRFATVEQAKRALSELKFPVVKGKQCGVAPSQDNDTLFVGNICKTWTKEHLKDKLKSFGVNNVEDLTLVEDTSNEGMNRGFAFLEFTSRSEAMEAFKCLQKRDVFLGTDRTVKVSFADSFIEPDDEIMKEVTTVFVDGLPAAWDEEHVKEYLRKYGTIEKIELARNMPSAKRKDFGFITFDTHENAVACAEGINNKELGEKDSKVKVRARLSRPHQKGRGKRGIRADIRIGRGALRGSRVPYSRPPPPSRFSSRVTRPISARGTPIGVRGFKRSIPYREKRPYIAAPERPRRLPPPDRSYDRRPPVPAYPKSTREYSRRDEPPSRSRSAAEYAPRVPMERRSAYREDYSARGSGYSDIPPRSAPRILDRRAYAEEGYGRKLERPLTSYREGRNRDYDSVAGSKRPYSELDDAPPRYADVNVRHSRARLEYGASGSSAQYDDGYGDRLGRSHMGYGSGRSSLSGQDGLYSSRHGMSYGGGSVGDRDVGEMYSSSYGSSYLQRGSDDGGSSYSSLYSGRSGLSGNGYLGGSGSGSYY